MTALFPIRIHLSFTLNPYSSVVVVVNDKLMDGALSLSMVLKYQPHTV